MYPPVGNSNNVGLDPRYPSSESDNSAFSRTPLLACFSPIHFSVFLHNYSETDLATDLAVRVLKYSRTAVYQEHGGVKKNRTHTRTRHAAPALPPLRLGHQICGSRATLAVGCSIFNRLRCGFGWHKPCCRSECCSVWTYFVVRSSFSRRRSVHWGLYLGRVPTDLTVVRSFDEE